MISNTAIVFILLFLAGSSTAILIDPSYGIFLYLFEYFLNPSNRWWWGDLPHLRFAYIIGIVTMVGYIMRHGKYSKNRIFDAPQTKWLILFGILMIATWPIAVARPEHERFLILFAKYLVLYLLIVKIIDTPKKFEKLIGVFLLGNFYIGWLVYTVGRTSGGRVEGIGTADAKDANGLAAVLVVSIPIMVTYLITGKKWQKLCVLPILVFVLNALILVNSRGAFVAIICSMTYYTLCLLMSSQRSFLKANLRINKLKILIGIAGCVVLFMYLADPTFWARMSTITDPEAEGRASRMFYWSKTFDMLKEHPFGLGARGYEILSPQYLPTVVLSKETNTRAVHSTYFQALAEYGYHGFVLFMVFLYSNFRYLRKIKRSLIQKGFYEPYYMAIALEAGFLAHLVAGITQNRLYAEILYWLPAFIAAYGNIYFKEMKRLEKNVDEKEVSPKDD